MKTLDDLIDNENPFVHVMNDWIDDSKNKVEVLPPSGNQESILSKVQVTTKSLLGSLIYYTGGVLIDNGWVRVLGSGSERLTRDVHSWNTPIIQGAYLVADDAAGGFFAINGGAFPGEKNFVHYWSPDSFEWEPLELAFSDFFRWLLFADLNQFYDGLRWGSWENDLDQASPDQCYSFYPPLWSEEGDCDQSFRGLVPVKEALDVKFDVLSQINKNT